MKNLLVLTALIEGPTGLALLFVPVFVVKLLLGAEISGAAIPLARVAGVAVLALGIACWFAGGDTKSRAGKGLVIAMLLYNLGAVGILGAAGIWSPPAGIALWPAVILHVVLSAWCGRIIVSWGKQISH